MPLINPKDDAVQPNVESEGRAFPIEMSTPVVETRFKPLSSLLLRASGSIYVANYYRQVVTQDSQLIGHQQEKDAVYQQYELIRQFELKLQGDLGYSQDENSNDQIITGEALVYPCVPANKGDMFIADAGEGRMGLFKVTSSQRTTWMMQAFHRIAFQMVDIQGSPTWALKLADLEDKVVQRNHFVKDFMANNKSPIVADETFQEYRDLKRIYQTMAGEYFRTFFSEATQTLLIPNQREASYDPFLVRAMLALSDTFLSKYVQRLNEHNVEVDPTFRCTTVWDSLLYMEPSHLHVATHRMCLRSTAPTYNLPALGGLYWTNILYVIYPIDKRQDADLMLIGTSPEEGDKLIKSWAPMDDFQRLVLDTDASDVEIVDGEAPKKLTPNIHRITNDEYYVFSKAFYFRDAPNMSRLELLVWAALDQNDIDQGILLDLVEESKQWDNLERFYYVPVLMVLCILVLRGPNMYGE